MIMQSYFFISRRGPIRAALDLNYPQMPACKAPTPSLYGNHNTMTFLRSTAFLFLSTVSVCSYSQFSLPKTMPDVARPAIEYGVCDKPEYPKSALRNGEQGIVTVKYLIGLDGAILEGRVVKSSGSFELDKATLVGLAKCFYKVPEGMVEPTYVFAQFVWKLT